MIWLSKMRVAPTVLALGALLLAGLPVSAEDAPKAQKAPEHKTTQSKSYIMVDPIYSTIVADSRPAKTPSSAEATPSKRKSFGV